MRLFILIFITLNITIGCKIDQKEENKEIRASFYSAYELGANYFLSKLDFEEGYKRSLSTLELAKGLNNPEFIALSNNLLGAFHYETGQYETALSFYDEVINEGENIYDNNKIRSEVLGRGYINLCMVKIKLAKNKSQTQRNSLYAEASKYLSLFKDLNFEDVENHQGDSHIYEKLYLYSLIYGGTLSCIQGESEKGLDSLAKALKLTEAEHLREHRDDAYFYYGYALNIIGQHSEAIDVLTSGLNLAKNKSTEIDICKELKKAYLKLEEEKKAVEYLQRALVLEEDIRSNMTEDFFTVVHFLNAKDKIRANEKQTLSLLILIIALISIIMGGYLFLQRRRTLELKKANREIKKANIAAQTFISILAHQSKGRIDTLKNQVKSFRKKAGSQLENKHQFDIELIEDFTSRLSNTFHNLLVWARPNAGADINMKLEKINLEKAYGRSSEFGNEAIKEGNLKNLKIRFKLNPKHDIYASETFTGVIMRNVIENAIKYSKGENILISSKVEKDKLQIIVEDDGDGMPAHKMNEDLFNFDAPLDDDRRVGGFGFKISNKLSRQQGGRLEVRPRKPQGTMVIVTCKKFKQCKSETNHTVKHLNEMELAPIQ